MSSHPASQSALQTAGTLLQSCFEMKSELNVLKNMCQGLSRLQSLFPELRYCGSYTGNVLSGAPGPWWPAVGLVC